MALTMLPAGGMWLPRPQAFLMTFSSTPLIDATGEKIAFVGQVWTPNQGSKSIRKVGFRFGAVTKAGGSALTVSLQDIAAGTGPPAQPDGTPDQTVAIANADATFASNTWHQTANLSADRTVNFGELLAVVIEFDGAGRLGADSVVVSTTAPNAALLGASNVALNTGAWAYVSSLPNLLLEFSDGTFGSFLEGTVFSNLSTHAFNVNTAGADEYGLEFQVPWECQVDAAWIQVQHAANTADYEMILYTGVTGSYNTTTPMTNGTITVDANTNATTGAAPMPRLFPAPLTLQANTPYILAARPTTTSNITIPYGDVANANYWAAWDGGSNWKQVARLDQGTWTPTATRRPGMGLRFTSFHPAGGGSGGPVAPGRLTGGLQ